MYVILNSIQVVLMKVLTTAQYLQSTIQYYPRVQTISPIPMQPALSSMSTRLQCS